jgi:hypothetical protein
MRYCPKKPARLIANRLHLTIFRNHCSADNNARVIADKASQLLILTNKPV